MANLHPVLTAEYEGNLGPQAGAFAVHASIPGADGGIIGIFNDLKCLGKCSIKALDLDDDIEIRVGLGPQLRLMMEKKAKSKAT